MQPLIATREATPVTAVKPSPKAPPKPPSRREAEKPRVDPAPSRAAYRMQRVMLTPAYRLTLRVLLPFVISMSVVAVYMSDADRRDAVVLGLQDLRNQIETRPEFMVKLMAIDGASTEVEADIREISQIDFPVSTFDLDLETLRTSILGLPAVADVGVRVKQLGVLEVTVTERQPALLWRSRNGVQVLDETGIVIGDLGSRTLRPDLPLIAGHGADRAVNEALELLRIAEPLQDRLRGLVRIGERRWDVVLDPDLRIMLPDDRPDLALERAIALHEAQDVLNRDVSALDLRLAARPTIRMNAGALDRWRQIKDMVVETGN
ncbi:cell division protein FtsQ [Primorskyibacter flagellatus]|uniref:Cell division protein FtsQ n=1 Tax=Primorskyibacter flagellatus TaxID=1387277 RepID=A0A917A719_9RHOB|nr:cell division protein FtsQ/DivIB [Primorskyibacter flagellatus]GGE32008.1 cell division protein FtsQ [Primorskyibacter flagellatus]